MTRVKKALNALKTRRNVLKKTKGFRFGRSTKERQAYEALVHAGSYAFAHRRDKKSIFRRTWQIRIGAALKVLGTSYSKFIGSMKKNNVEIDRKILADLAEHNPKSFEAVVNKVMQ